MYTNLFSTLNTSCFKRFASTKKVQSEIGVQPSTTKKRTRTTTRVKKTVEATETEEPKSADIKKPKKSSEFTRIDIYTDGSCIPNPGPGGYAAIIQFAKRTSVISERIIAGNENNTTNNRMELTATVRALESLKDSKTKIRLYTDSKYVRDGITSWMKTWKQNEWQTTARAPVKNQDLWMLLDSSILGLKIEWKWVKAHAGHVQNERVDKLAKEEALRIENK